MKHILAAILFTSLLAGQTAKYPTAVATDADLKIAKNRVQTTLRGSITAAATDIVVASATGIVANMLLCIENEVVSVTSIAGTTLTVVRGFDGTVAAAHSASRTVGNCVAAWYWTALSAEVKAIQTTLGPNMINVPGGGDVNGPAAGTGGELPTLDATGHVLARSALTGVLKATTGVPSVVTGTGTDCVLVNGSSGACGTGTGDVVGPGAAVNSNFAGFDGTTGKLIKDSGSKAADFAVAAKGVTNGDTHDHFGGDGAQIAYSGLSGIPATFAPSSHASNHKNLGGDEVATATPGANEIVKAEAAGTIALGWIPALPNSKTTATAANTPSTIVARDGSGNFAGGMYTGNVTGALTGNADTVTGGVYVGATNTMTGYTNFSGGRTRMPETTFVSPPGTPLTGQVWLFTDAISAGVCTGGGTAKAQCRYTGAAWESIGGGGGGGGDAYLSANQSWTGRNSWTPTSNQAITAASNTVLCDGNSVQVTPSADLVLTSTPTIAAGTAGQTCLVLNLSTTKYLTLQDESILTGSTLRLFGGANARIPPRGTLAVRYNATLGWVQEGGNTGQASSEFIDFKPIAAGALLTVEAGRARIGNYAPTTIARGTALFTAGSGDVKVFIDQNMNLVCHMATGIAATAGGSMTCSNVASPVYPANSIPIADLTITAVTFAVTIDSDDRAFFSNKGVSAGTGIAVTDSGGVASVAIDTATVPTLGGSNAPTGSWDFTGASGLLVNAETAGTTITTVQKRWLQAVNCTGTTATLNWDTIATLAPAVACTAGTTNTGLIRGLATFSNSEISQMQTHFALPSDWTGAVDLKFKWQSAVHDPALHVVWQAAAICVADAEVNDAAWNTASEVIDHAQDTTLATNDATITGLTTTGCAAGEILHLKVFRDPDHASDDLADAAELIGVEITTRRAQ